MLAAWAAAFAIAAIGPELALGLLGLLLVAIGAGGHLFAVLVLVAIVTLARALILEAGAVLVENAIIMVRELQIIFGLDAIPGQLGVAGQRLVFLQQLGGIAPRPVVLAIARIGTAARRTRSAATAATATVLTIVDQTNILVTGGLVPATPSVGPVPAAFGLHDARHEGHA
jgi:hypothetical protein